ncbi:MAG TPA: hypothetical protein VFG77_04645 [Nitrososphaeraceae archaeon]|nr:hypothetical protein [Nitrososphaeraceae archaeon]
MNRSSLLYSTLVVTILAGFFFSPFVPVATGQTTENNLMDLITKFGGGNETDDESMMMMGENMMGGANMSGMPFNMGVFVMPMTCTSPNELLGSMFGMSGSAGGDSSISESGSDNSTQSMMMDMMGQQMMSSGDMNGMNGMMGMSNMTDAEMEHIMSMNICFPMMGEKMTDGMMGMMGR